MCCTALHGHRHTAQDTARARLSVGSASNPAVKRERGRGAEGGTSFRLWRVEHGDTTGVRAADAVVEQ